MQIPQSAIDRLHSYIDKSAGADGCWLWTGQKDKDGYGKFTYCPTGVYPQRHVRAHRVILQLETDTVGPCAIHSCDTPACCNHKHLRWGTPQENRADCVRKKRQARGATHNSVTRPEGFYYGDKHCHAKLKDQDLLDIHRDYRPRANTAELAAKYGVHRGVIAAIGNGHYKRFRSVVTGSSTIRDRLAARKAL